MTLTPATKLSCGCWLLAMLCVPTFVWGQQAISPLAQDILKLAPATPGICAVLGGPENLGVELAQKSKWLVHVRTSDAALAGKLRQLSSEKGLGLQRLTAEQGSLLNLPYAEHLVDVLVAADVDGATLGKTLSAPEMLRALRPRGMALVGRSGAPSKAYADQLLAWASSIRADKLQVIETPAGQWLQFFKPPLAGADDWSHWEKSPDNNPVSKDQVIRAPYMTQYMAHPMYIGMPAVTTAAAGRTFLAIGHIAHHRREWHTLNKLIARNGYNGTVLWQRDLPEGYLVHRSAFIATADTFYMIAGDRCAMLDPDTGNIKGTLQVPGVEGHWKWMAMRDGVLYVLAGDKDPDAELVKGERNFGGWSWADLSKGYYGKDIPWGYGRVLAAYHLKDQKTLWTHPEPVPIDARSLSMVDNKLFLFCPQKYVRCLEAADGKVIWTNEELELVNMIEEPGKGLSSTPGFKTACLAVATPKALILQGQTRMNVVALSTETGYLLWNKKKVTNNPNAVFIDNQVVLGVGDKGSHVAIDPVSGAVKEDFGFFKRACTRLTACDDSLFCRGEGTLRWDREQKKLLIDGSVRPACNDGALPANGMLYLGPWQCDCNLSLIGQVTWCSAGSFKFDHQATDATRLQVAANANPTTPLPTTAADWPTFRHNAARNGSTSTPVATQQVHLKWDAPATQAFVPTPAIAAGGLVFITGEDGCVRALTGDSGKVKWTFATSSPIKSPATVWEDRLYVGSGDGFAYCLEAATGRQLWRFQAAPVERHLMLYGTLASTWPVNSGVLVADGTAYFAAGVIDHDGTYVYAVDAKSGKLQWQNNTTGHLQPDLRKGVSVQGNLALMGDQLLLAGGNQVSPARFDRKTGKLVNVPFEQGDPKANGGQFVGVVGGKYPMVGGRILYSAPQNVATKGSFALFDEQKSYTLNYGGITPVWNQDRLALVNFRNGKLMCCDMPKVLTRFAQGYPETGADRRWQSSLALAFEKDGAVQWQSNLDEPNRFEVISLAASPNAVVGVIQYQELSRSQPQWYLVAFSLADGIPLYRLPIQGEPLPGGLLIDRQGQLVVTMLDGRLLCFTSGK